MLVQTRKRTLAKSVLFIKNDDGAAIGLLAVYEDRERLYPVRDLFENLVLMGEAAGYLILFTVLLLAAVIACRALSCLIRYRVGSPEEKLAMDAEAIKKQIRRRAGEDFPDRGLLSDYVDRAPPDLQDDIRRIFDAYYRILYGNAGAAGVSPPENELARRVREDLALSSRSALRSAAGEGREP